MRTSLIVLIGCCLLAAPSFAGPIRGTVMSNDGKPVANAEIVAYAVEGAGPRMERIVSGRPRPALAKTTSAADGAFAIDVAGYGCVLLGVTAVDYGWLFAEQVIGDEDVFLELTRAQKREWKVEAGGKPVAGARVIVFLQNGDYELKSDASGKVAFGESQPSALFVFADDYAPQIARETEGRVITLERGVAVRGEVLNADHVGVPGARILINSVPLATSAPDGTFTILHIPSARYMIEADAGDAAGMATGTKNPVRVTVRKQLALTGVVRDPGGHPLRGVALFAASDGMESFDLSTVSDEKGAFALHLFPGKYQLMVSGVYQAPVVTVNLDKPLVHDVVAKRLPEITGIVRTEGGAPVANARVTPAIATPPQSIDFPDEVLASVPSVLTRADGRFRLGSMVEGMKFYVDVTKDGFAPAESDLVESRDTGSRAPIAIVMRKGTEVAVDVTDSAHKPVAGATVTVAREGRMVRPAATVTTDESGRAKLRLADGTWRIAGTSGHSKKTLRNVAFSTKNNPIALQLESETTLRGHVLSADGKPVAGVMVALESGKKAMSGTDGAFSIADAGNGTVTLMFMTRDGDYGRRTVTAPADDVRIVLDETGEVAGRVVDANGAAVTDFNIRIEGARDGDIQVGPARDFSDPNGAFALSAVHAGEATLVVSAAGFTAAKQTVTVAAAKPVAGLVVTLSRGRTIRGKITAPNGQPVGSALVSTTDAVPVRSGDDGKYEATGAAFGTETLSVEKEGFVAARRRVDAGTADAVVDIQLVAGRTVTGHVLTSDGKPVREAMVRAESAAAGAESGSGISDDEGAFSIDGLLAARYDFVASVEGGGGGKVIDVDVTKTSDVTIRLQPPTNATITGTIAGADEGATLAVNVSTVAGDERSVMVDGSGKFRVENAPTGTVTITAMTYNLTRRRSSARATVEVAPNSTTNVDLTFHDPVAIGGRVLLNGAPLAGAKLSFSSVDADSADAVTNDAGAYETKLAPGHYDVRVTAAAVRGNFETERDVAGAGVVDISIATRNVTVTVVDATAGTPIDRAAVSTRDASQQTHMDSRGFTATNGQASIVAPSDATQIVVEKDGYATAIADVAPSVTVPLTRTEGAVVRIIDARDGRTLTGYAIARDASGRVIASANDVGTDGLMHLPLLPGSYRFSASASEYGSQTVTADVPAGEVRIALPRGGKLSLRSQTIAEATARLIEPSGEEYVRCWCSGIAEIKITRGVTLVDSIAPGSYALEVSTSGAKPRRIPVTVIEGETTAVNVDP